MFVFAIHLNRVIVAQQLKERDSKLEEAGDLHRFLRSVDHFQAWLTKTQTDVASEGIVNCHIAPLGCNDGIVS